MVKHRYVAAASIPLRLVARCVGSLAVWLESGLLTWSELPRDSQGKAT